MNWLEKRVYELGRLAGALWCVRWWIATGCSVYLSVHYLW